MFFRLIPKDFPARVQPLPVGACLTFKTHQNMKKHLMFLAFICLAITSGEVYAQTKESRDISNFTKVDFGIPGKLYIRQGSDDKVEIEADKEMLSKIETKLEGSRLIIKTPDKFRWRSGDDDDIKVYVTIKKLEGLSASGSGDVIGESKFTTNDLTLKVSGSGSLTIEAEASGEVEADVSGSGNLQIKGSSKGFDSGVSGSGRVELDMNIDGNSNFSISGSGRIEAAGKTDDVEIAISGSGKVLGADLEANRCRIRISGSGNVEINVREELDSHISGSGSVSYKGNPSKVNNDASGSGTLRKL
jgi:hypothetical protein